MKTLITIVTVLALGACGKKDKPAPEPGSASAAPVATGSDTAGSGSAVASGSGSGSAAEPALDLPTEMDYEELAAEEITDKTVEARLKELEGQLSAQ
jgi:hypothetical protein